MRIPQEVRSFCWFVWIVFLTALVVAVLDGCCWTAKRDCFPPCPPTPVQVVQVERPCELPPPVVIPAITRQPCEAALSLSCYTPGEAAKLARSLAELKAWIAQARARCGAPVPASAPASAPRARNRRNPDAISAH